MRQILSLELLLDFWLLPLLVGWLLGRRYSRAIISVATAFLWSTIWLSAQLTLVPSNVFESDSVVGSIYHVFGLIIFALVVVLPGSLFACWMAAARVNLKSNSRFTQGHAIATSVSFRRRIVTWLQLLRLPNVFTAAADVMMGYLVARHEMQPTHNVVLLIMTSVLLYLSGMVLNDVFDADVDALEQPQRSIPSGRISRTSAALFGWSLLLSGLIIARIITYLENDWRPAVVATVLSIIILLYDGWLKHSRFGPLLMGECRFLNVLLGMSLMIVPWGRAELLIAAGIGIYVMGVTVFARTDAHVSSRAQLTSGFSVILMGMALLAATPWLSYFRPPLELPTGGWYLLWAALFLITGRRCVVAIFEPSPKRVQAAVRHCVQSIIVLDAAVCAGYVGSYWGLVIISFLIPTLFLTLWLRAT